MISVNPRFRVAERFRLVADMDLRGNSDEQLGDLEGKAITLCRVSALTSISDPFLSALIRGLELLSAFALTRLAFAFARSATLTDRGCLTRTGMGEGMQV